MITTIVSFVVVIGVLILIHELGHFIVARLAGVGVERFSIGFGPVIKGWKVGETEYCLSAIPMGGYVKMVGEENPLEGGRSAVFDRTRAFSFKPLWARFLIVFAGPAMNFVLAAVILATMLMIVGRQLEPPVVGRVVADGPAARAGLQTGDRITAFGDVPIASWQDLRKAVRGSDGREVRLGIERGGERLAVTLTPQRRSEADLFGDTKEVWDIGVGQLKTPQVTTVTPGWPAARAGFQSGDIVVAVARQPVYSPDEVKEAIEKRPGEQFELTIERDGQRRTLSVTANRVPEKSPAGKEVEVGRIGIGIDSKMAVTLVRLDPVTAVAQGVAETAHLTALTVTGFWKLISGKIDSANIGGPLQIATEAGRQARQGVAALAFFTAFISVNLAVLNLLPVPMLDGGHLFFFVIEAVLGRPISLKKREAAQQLGFVLLMLLMVYALYNDLMRLDAFSFFK